MSANSALRASYGSSKVETLVDRTAGTHIGTASWDLNGVSTCFDGTTNRGSASCAVKIAATYYVGTEWTSGKIFSKAIVYASNNAGFSSSGAVSITLDIYGKNSTPASETDGTIIGTTTFTNTTNESGGRTVTSTDTSTSYKDIWVRASGTSQMNCAQLTLYELI